MSVSIGIVGRTFDVPNEGALGQQPTITLKVQLSQAATQPVTVDYEFVDGTARNGIDYIGANGTLRFEVGQTEKLVSLQLIGDDDDEAQEFLLLQLKNPAGATLVQGGTEGQRSPQCYVYIQNDDRGPPANIEYLVPEMPPAFVAFETVNLADFVTSIAPDQAAARRSEISHGVLAVGDLNSDGYDDIVVGTSVRGDPITGSTSQGYVLFFDPEQAVFRIDEAFQAVLDASRYPRRAVIADFDGDGRNDLFIGDTDEFQTLGGSRNQLVLQTGQGWTNATAKLPPYIDYTHGVVPADFDRDGRMDLLVLNSPLSKSRFPQLTNKSYVLTFKPEGTLVERTLVLANPGDIAFDEAQASASGTTYFSGIAPDLNGDGYPDLVLALSATGEAQDSGKVVILESTGPWRYGPAITIDPPAALIARARAVAPAVDPNGNEMQYSEFAAVDIDADGTLEVVGFLFNSDPANHYAVNSGLQVLKRDAAGQYTDVTALVVPQQYDDPGARGAWPQRPVQRADLDLDGDLDLLTGNLQSLERGYPNDFWVVDDGQLKPWLPVNYYEPSALNPNLYANEVAVRLGESNYLLFTSLPYDFREWSVYATAFEVGVIASSSGDIWWGTYRGEVIQGLRSSDRVQARGGDDTLVGGEGDDHLDGGDGVDTATYSGARADYAVAWSESLALTVEDRRVFAQVQGAPGGDGLDELLSVERVAFSDKSLAFDLQGNAGLAARLLATVFGQAAIGNAVYAGIGIRFFDQGMSLEEVSQIALDARFGPGAASTVVVSQLWKHLVGTDIDEGSLSYYRGLIDSGARSAAQLAAMAAGLELTAALIGLGGLADSGWEFIPFAG